MQEVMITSTNLILAERTPAKEESMELLTASTSSETSSPEAIIKAKLGFARKPSRISDSSQESDDSSRAFTRMRNIFVGKDKTASLNSPVKSEQPSEKATESWMEKMKENLKNKTPIKTGFRQGKGGATRFLSCNQEEVRGFLNKCDSIEESVFKFDHDDISRLSLMTPEGNGKQSILKNSSQGKNDDEDNDTPEKNVMRRQIKSRTVKTVRFVDERSEK